MKPSLCSPEVGMPHVALRAGLSRRHFLRAAGVALSLPLLYSGEIVGVIDVGGVGRRQEPCHSYLCDLGHGRTLRR